ncbi:MAG: hypothetical protein M1825_003201 [Sarcosagium campestre]|nr:MAG: hypothetical protein M1825_003201 [Sarcosagium campestre]
MQDYKKTHFLVPSFPPVRACIFDMDGLLLNSEEVYTLVTNHLLRAHGKPDLPWSIKAQLQGRPGPEAGKIFYDWAQLPISTEEYLTRQSELQAQLFPTVEPLPGVKSLLETLSSTPGMHMAVATSSHSRNYDLKTAHLSDVFSIFHDERIVKGDDPRLQPGRGKPAPDIFLLALKTINNGIAADADQGRQQPIRPEECLVFEDAVPGVEAGRRAGMRVVWVPHPGLLNEYRGREKEVLAGLTGEHKPEKSVAPHAGNPLIDGTPGEIDDGWADLLDSLEGFPYEKYGINIPSHQS